MERTHQNGTLGLSNVGQKVALVGWVSKKRNLGSLLFIDLRDRSGIVQILVSDPSTCPDIRNEYVISVTGTVRAKEVANKNLASGTIEVVADHLTVINKALTTPMIIDDNTDALEEIRLAYRYLDLRRPVMQKNLITRSRIVKSFHEFLDSEGFLEIETPILSLSTPGGARDYLVPSRLQHGSFYALPQSPQIYKQLLMIAGLERYYQVARCFRDEDLRADRQPDFTQIDIETSFLDQKQLLSILEKAVARVFHDVKNIKIDLPLNRLTYEQAMTNFGSDKPDTRFDLKITDLKKVFINSSYEPFLKDAFVKGIVVKGQANVFSRKLIDDLSFESKKYDIKNLIVLKLVDNQLTGSFTKMLSPEELATLIKKFELKNDDVLVMASGNDFKKFHSGLGSIRLSIARNFKLIDTTKFDLLWVTDFPLFEVVEDGHLVSSHHPFTRPRDEDLKYLNNEPQRVLAQAFDLVLNGNEAGGGSMRIFDKDIQYRIFELLGMSEKDIKTKFGWFIEAFNYGTPPHGGFAFGLDRLTMILTGVDNIRDVIAFPKNLSAIGPLEKTPAPVEAKQLEELGLIIKEKK